FQVGEVDIRLCKEKGRALEEGVVPVVILAFSVGAEHVVALCRLFDRDVRQDIPYREEPDHLARGLGDHRRALRGRRGARWLDRLRPGGVACLDRRGTGGKQKKERNEKGFHAAEYIGEREEGIEEREEKGE